MSMEENGAFIRNIAEVPWREFPNHFGGALSKPLVMPETAKSRHSSHHERPIGRDCRSHPAGWKGEGPGSAGAPPGRAEAC